MNALIRHHLAKIGGAVLIATLAVAALPGLALADEQIQGTIQSINGTWNITVADVNGYLDNVGLHQGTIINPTGLTLAPGMSVTILGYTDGNVFQANEIDTPYQYSGPVPVPVYYGPAWWYPGYAFGYGPSFSLVLNFGGDGDDFWIDRHPWGGHWWAATPVHPYVGFWMGHYWDGNWQGGTVYTPPARRYPESHAYSRPEVRSYARPEAHVYRAPEARSYAPARNYAPAQRYSAPVQRYSAPVRYTAPSAQYSGGGRESYGGSRGGHYEGGARTSGGGHYEGGGRTGGGGYGNGDRGR